MRYIASYAVICCNFSNQIQVRRQGGLAINWAPIIEFLGGATAISLSLAYLGKRAIDSFALGRLEAYRSELELLSEERRDALTRKRDVYGRVASSMRVFLSSGAPSTEDEKREFMAAFDQGFLWASEDVGKSLVDFLQLSTRHSADPRSVSNDEFKDAYRECLIAMRRDCGFADTKLKYPVVSFR